MKQFFRNFSKQKVVGLLNICSLSLGIMIAIIVGLWALNELSFDNFHKNKEKMYRVIERVTLNDSPTKLGSTFRPFGEDAKAELPVLEDMCRVYPTTKDIRIDNVLYPSVAVYIVDTNFFSFFTFSLKEGDPNTVFSSRDKVVLSEKAATRYFPEGDPIGKTIHLEGQDFTVGAVMYDMPRNSSLYTDIVLPLFGRYKDMEWGANDSYITFFVLQDGVDPQSLSEPFNQILYNGLPFAKTMGIEMELEAMKDIHFSSGFLNEFIVKGNKPLIMVFVLVAAIILIISCINFTNLFISTSFIRARSIGIKKSQGAAKASLIYEFLGETACYTFIAIILGFFLAVFSLPVFNNFTQSNLVIDLSSIQLYLFLILLFLFTVFLAGTFPAIYMTRFNTIETLTGKFKGKQISYFQKSLIIIQFSASIALLIVISFMQRQVDFMIGQDLGFDKENVLYVQGKGDFGKNFKVLRDELMKEPSISDMTLKQSLPTEWERGWPIHKLESEDEYLMEVCYIEPNYFDFFDMDIIMGENPFYLESKDSISNVVVNETVVRILGLEQPIDQILTQGYEHFVIKGVVRNANVRSFHKEIDPQIYFKNGNDQWCPIFFKISGDPKRAIDVIRQKWEEQAGDYPFEYHFLDDTYKQLYLSEMNAGKVLAYAMFITFIISVAGLFAMAYYATQRRIREIGLRKVNGATIKDLLVLLNKDFLLWVSIAFLIAVPIAYFSLQSWLNTFTVKVSLSVWIFLLVGIVSLLVTILTTSFQTWKVATMNPVNTLKSE